MRKEHAERNEQLNDELIKGDVYHDWIVTTAFYSAIHFVEHKLFTTPFIFNSKTVNSLEQAHSSIDSKLRRSRHETRGVLVRLKLHEIQVQYDFLRKQSQTARYIDYKVKPQLASQAKNCLNKIKARCVTQPPTAKAEVVS